MITGSQKFNVAKCDLGKVHVSSMLVSASCHGSGATFVFSAGGAQWFALHLLACWPARWVILPALLSSPRPLSALPLVSIGSGKYSTDWVQCDGTVGCGRLQGCHGYLLPRAWLLTGSTNLLGRSSIVDEFKGILTRLSLLTFFPWNLNCSR